jgi:hypothetical protein
MELYIYSPNTPSWGGAQLRKAQGQLLLYLSLKNVLLISGIQMINKI